MEYRLECEAGRLRITGHRAAVTLEGDPNDPGGRQLSGNTHSGGQIVSWIDAHGRFSSDLTGVFEGGRATEWHVLKILLQALDWDGVWAAEIAGARDDHGEDRLVQMEGTRWVVQMVSVPADPSVWRELSANPMVLQGDLNDAVNYLRGAIEKKRFVSRDVILVLDASLLGAAVTQRLADAYIERYGSPEGALGAAQVWLIGRTERSAFRMTGPKRSEGFGLTRA